MKKCHLSLAVLFFIGLSGLQANDMKDAVQEAVSILTKKQNSDKPIPTKLLQQAKAIGIIEITKGAIGVGGSHGEGIIIARTAKGWSAPFAFTQGGGSVGFQIGVDIKRYIYIFNT